VIRPRVLFFVAPLALVPALAIGCSTSSQARDPFSPDAAPAPTTFEPTTCSEPPTCSTDLLSVVACEKATPCGPGLGCLKGACVPACEAALAQQSTIGCEYFATIPSDVIISQGSCYAVMIANVWNTPVDLALSWGDRKLSTSYIRRPRGAGSNITYELLPDGKLPPNEIAIAFLSSRKPASGRDWTGTPCPAEVGAAITEEAWVPNGGRGKAFHLETTAPVITYDIYPYGGAPTYFPSASLLLPVSAWGKNYIAIDGYGASPEMLNGTFFPYMQIVAAEDDTTVSLLPPVTLRGGPNLPDAPPGVVYTTKLARGEFLQFSQRDEVNGTLIESDRPVAVVGGNSCADIPFGKDACDSLHQALPPISLMGDAYVATRYRDRRSTNDTNLEIVPWRIVGVVDGTELRYDPEIPDAPKTVGRGETVEFRAPGPFIVRTQDKAHPIYVGSYMTAGDLAPYHPSASDFTSGHGDPEWVNVPPLDQFISNYVFLTDPTFGNTNLVFVRSTANGGGKDVTLDCLGPVTGWQKVGSSDYEMARVDLMFRGQPVGECANGAHRAWSDAPFGLTVWGFDDYASYGYVAGMSAKPLNEVRVPVIR